MPTWLLDVAESVRLPASATVYRQGDPGSRIYLVLGGLVALEHRRSPYPQRATSLLRAGAMFGEDAAVEPFTRMHTARTIGTTQIAAVDVDEIARAVCEDATRADSVLRLLARRSRAEYEELDALTFDDAPARIARALLRLPRSTGPGPIEYRIDATISQQGFATMVGVSRETVNRTLLSWQRRGWIRREGRTVYVVDEASIARRASAALQPGRHAMAAHPRQAATSRDALRLRAKF